MSNFGYKDSDWICFIYGVKYFGNLSSEDGLEAWDDQEEERQEEIENGLGNIRRKDYPELQIISVDYEYEYSASSSSPLEMKNGINCYLVGLNIGMLGINGNGEGSITVPTITERDRQYISNFLRRNPLFSHLIPDLYVYGNVQH